MENLERILIDLRWLSTHEKNPRDILNHENKNPGDFALSNQIPTFEIKA